MYKPSFLVTFFAREGVEKLGKYLQYSGRRPLIQAVLTGSRKLKNKESLGSAWRYRKLISAGVGIVETEPQLN